MKTEEETRTEMRQIDARIKEINIMEYQEFDRTGKDRRCKRYKELAREKGLLLRAYYTLAGALEDNQCSSLTVAGGSQ